jgi:hypothetical protein
VIKARSDQMGRSQNDSKKQERLTLVCQQFQADSILENSLFSPKMTPWHCAQAVREGLGAFWRPFLWIKKS